MGLLTARKKLFCGSNMVLDREAGNRLDALYRKHHSDVFRLCLRFCAGDRPWAMDRTQEVFVKLALCLDELVDTEDLGGWLYRVGANVCLMELRRQRGWRKVVDVMLRAPERRSLSPEREVRARHDVSDVERAIHHLPPHERAVMVLVYLDGKSQTDAAKLLGLSKGQVSKLHARALANLRAQDWEVACA